MTTLTEVPTMKRRFEMYQYRQVLVRMRLGDSDREIARAGLMGRRKAAALRQVALDQGWLNRDQPVPEAATLAEVLTATAPVVTTPSLSLVEPYREQVTAWWQGGVQGTAIHQALVRQHGFTGSDLSVARFLQGLQATVPKATVILEFAPGDAVQVDFGRGPDWVDTHTGELKASGVLVMTLCWSRHQYAEIVEDQTVWTGLACHRRAFEGFNGVPRRVIIDHPKCAITRACFMTRKSNAPMANSPRATAFAWPPARRASRRKRVGSRPGLNTSTVISWRCGTSAIGPTPISHGRPGCWRPLAIAATARPGNDH